MLIIAIVIKYSRFHFKHGPKSWHATERIWMAN